MTIPRISVAMSVYNSARFLAEAVESILTQTFEEFEFLILDDGSTDESGEIIAGFAALDPRIRPLRQPNRGLVASLNHLIEEARAPLIARMDGDDISLPQRFERQLAFLDSNPDYGIVGCWASCIDDAGAAIADTGSDHPTDHGQFVAALESRNLLCHSSVMMKRDLVRAAGGYRAAFRHCEDYDLWLRLSESTRLCSIPERLLRYRHSDDQVSSLHVVAQQYGAAVAYAAHLERMAGRPDPTAGLKSLPPVEQLDGLFGRAGIGHAIRAQVALGSVHSPVALRGDGFDMLLDHVREGGVRDGLWRTAARLVKYGEPVRALRLASALAAS